MRPDRITPQFGRYQPPRPALFPPLGLEVRLVAGCGCYRRWDLVRREQDGLVVCTGHRDEPWAPVRRRSGARSESWGT